MSHCLLDAYTELARNLRLPSKRAPYIYSTLKSMLQDYERPTLGSLSPFIVRVMASVDGLCVRAQHRIWLPEHYLASAETYSERLTAEACIRYDLFGEHAPGGITIEPAVYCSISSSHAFFSASVPAEDLIVFAFTLEVNK